MTDEVRGSEAELSLYHFDGCPFCRVVRDALHRLDVEIEQRNIHEDPRHLAELVRATGRTTVPCLRIVEGDTVAWMHESADIVRYLEARYGS
jgi:glutathione S-transferase